MRGPYMYLISILNLRWDMHLTFGCVSINRLNVWLMCIYKGSLLGLEIHTYINAIDVPMPLS